MLFSRLDAVNDRGPRISAALAVPCGGGSALQRGLELAAGAELRHRRRRDLDALTGARVHALAGGPGGGRELAEAREVDRVAALQGLGHGLHEGVDGLAGVAGREAALRRDLVDEVQLSQSLPPGSGCRLVRPWPKRLTTASDTAQPCGFAALSRSSEPVKRERSRTAARASASTPPSSRSTTQTALETRIPASRRASTASIAAPPDVTTSSIRQMHSPPEWTPSSWFAVP